MGQQAIHILDINLQKLLKMLNAAYSEEWLAYYQYWIGARLMAGPMKTEIEQELLVHANQELGHALSLVNRIIQLGGTPVLSPADWMKQARCRFEAPRDPYIEVILEQNLKGERCAIGRYKEIADFTRGKDDVTYQLAVTILNEEAEHEEDIESWMKDIRSMKKHFNGKSKSTSKKKKG